MSERMKSLQRQSSDKDADSESRTVQLPLVSRPFLTLRKEARLLGRMLLQSLAREDCLPNFLKQMHFNVWTDTSSGNFTFVFHIPLRWDWQLIWANFKTKGWQERNDWHAMNEMLFFAYSFFDVLDPGLRLNFKCPCTTLTWIDVNGFCYVHLLLSVTQISRFEAM